MNSKLTLAFAIMISLTTTFGHVAYGDDQPAQIIVLKLDDITAYGGADGPAINPRWQRVTDYLAAKGLKASYGIIGYSLEADNEPYFNWIKELAKTGRVEFWNHGYRRRAASDKTGEFEESFETQKTALEKTQQLAKEKLGINLVTFGPHWSGISRETVRAMESIPELKMWFYGPDNTTKLVFPRYLTLEYPTHNANFEGFKEAYERVGHDKPCLALQGHPCSWNDERWENFTKIIDFLVEKKCVFMTPSEYMAKVAAEKK